MLLTLLLLMTSPPTLPLLPPLLTDAGAIVARRLSLSLSLLIVCHQRYRCSSFVTVTIIARCSSFITDTITACCLSPTLSLLVVSCSSPTLSLLVDCRRRYHCSLFITDIIIARRSSPSLLLLAICRRPYCCSSFITGAVAAH